VTNKLELRIVRKRSQVQLSACKKIIEADDLVTISQKPFTKMGPEEAGAARH
jgi:hypothetical protein